MASISYEQFGELVRTFDQEAIHLETRDAYGTEVELPHMAKWAAGEPDDLVWLDDWCASVRANVAAGKSIRRAKIVSEPLSDYQRWAHDIEHPIVDAGEDIRWVSRRVVSSIGIPGNDYYLLDNRLVIFLHYAGSGVNVDFVTSTDPADVRLCRDAFDAVWKLSIPHRDYNPAQTHTDES